MHPIGEVFRYSMAKSVHAYFCGKRKEKKIAFKKRGEKCIKINYAIV